MSHRRASRCRPSDVTRLTPVGRPGTGYVPGVTTSSPLLTAGTSVVRLASRLRGERAIHSRGRAFSGRVVLPGGAGTGAALLDTAGSYDAVVRFSRSTGLPPALPDVYGLAVRLVDAHGPGAHQDLLLDSTQPAPLLRRLPWPRRDATGATYSTLLPYAAGSRRVLIGARAVPGTPVARSLPELPERLALALLVASPHGPWREVGRLATTGELPAPEGRRTRFSPAHSGGGLLPAGPLQEWRNRAYPASHVAPDET